MFIHFEYTNMTDEQMNDAYAALTHSIALQNASG